MDDTRDEGEEAESRWWGRGSYGDWLSIQDPQETPTTTTSVHLTPPSTSSVHPRHHHSQPTATQSNCTNVCGSARVCVCVCLRRWSFS